MNQLRRLAGLLLAAALLVAPQPAQACPACTEFASSTDVDDTDNFAAAMNESIYMMLGVPVSALLVVSFMVRRGMKMNDEFREGLQQ